VLEEYKVRPIGHTEEIPLDVRVIAASNHSIEELKNKYLRPERMWTVETLADELLRKCMKQN